MSLCANLIQQLKLEIFLRGIKHKWVAQKIGVSPQRLSRILSGKSQVSLEQLDEIAAAMGLHIEIAVVEPAKETA